MLTAIGIVEETLGVDIETAASLAEADLPGTLRSIFEPLRQFYYDQFELLHTEATTSARFACVSDFDATRNSPLQSQYESRLKHRALYFEQSFECDPLESVLSAPFLMVNLMGSWSPSANDLAELQRTLPIALRQLVVLKPFVEAGAIVTAPFKYGVGTPEVQQVAGKYFQSLSGGVDTIELRLLLGNLACWGALSDHWKLTPVCATASEQDGLENVLGTCATASQLGLARLGAQFQLPRIDRLSFDDVMKIRRNEETFAEWRAAYGELVTSVNALEPRSQLAFEKEWNERVGHIQGRLPTLSTTTMAAAAAAGVVSIGAIAYKVWDGAVFDPLELGIAAASPFAAVAFERILGQLSPSARRTQVIRDSFGSIMFS